MHEKFWREIRQDYQRLYRLSKTVEEHIALLVLISYIHNIFFLCIQLYNSIRLVYFITGHDFNLMGIIEILLLEIQKKVKYFHSSFRQHLQFFSYIFLIFRERTGIIESVYFFYSFGFLVLRLLVISMYGAWLNDEARKPLDILYAVPSEHYCTEVN